MKMLWVQFALAENWSKPQGWRRFGWTWNYVNLLFNKKLLIISGWATIKIANAWVKDE